MANSIGPRTDEGDILDVSNKDHYRSEFNLHIMLTRRCNLSCHYCYYPLKKDPKMRDMSKDVITKIIEESRALPFDFFFDLSGGEALIRKDILEVIELFLKEGRNTVLNSNGLLINPEIAKSFREFQQNYQFTPVISLDSHLAEFHEPCRGRFEDVIKSLEILKEYDVDFAVDITLGKHNSENILDTVRFVVENHTKNIVLCKLRPVYSSAKAEDFLSNEEILSIYNEVIELKEEYGGFNFFHSFDATGEEFCTAGMDKMSIGSDGSVFPCYMLEAMSFGNIDDTPLAELVELMRIKFGRNDIRQIVCQSPEYAKLLFDNTTVPSISLVD